MRARNFSMKTTFPRCSIWFFGAFLALCVSVRGADESAWFESNFEYVLGTSLELKFEARNSADAAVAEKAALAEIDRLAAVLSGYDTRSEFSRWTATRN